MTGRPSTYDRDKADQILLLIAEGEQSLRHACGEIGVPPGTFCGWVVDDIDGLAERYMRARQIRAHGLFDEMIEIADDASEDWCESEDKKGNKVTAFNREHVQRSQLRVGTRQWALARILRNEFAEKKIHEHGGKNGTPLKPVNLGQLTDAQLEALEAIGQQITPAEDGPAPGKRPN